MYEGAIPDDGGVRITRHAENQWRRRVGPGFPYITDGLHRSVPAKSPTVEGRPMSYTPPNGETVLLPVRPDDKGEVTEWAVATVLYASKEEWSPTHPDDW